MHHLGEGPYHVDDLSDEGSTALHHLPKSHLETGTTAIARHTLHITAVVSCDLADEGEAQANTALATLTYASGTVKGRKDTFPLHF